jgi:dTDP-4-dehydrorhamnose reductase
MGCGGMLGKAFFEELKSEYDIVAYDIDVNEDWLQYGDIRDFSFCKKEVQKVMPNMIINLAALTSLEQCERDPDNAFKTNTLGAENLVTLAQRYHIPIIHISTAGVYDGLGKEYTEYDTPNPISMYGKSKYEAEKIVLKYNQSYIFRAGWMMGGKNKDKKFVKLITDQINRGEKTIYAVNDKYGTPTYTKDFVKTALKTVDSFAPNGLYHCVCKGFCNRYEVAAKICQTVDPNIEVVPVSSDYFAKDYFANRPPDEGLRTFKLDALGLNLMKDWQVSLEEYLKEMYV